MGHRNYAQCKFYVYVSTDATADADYSSKFASFILTLEKSELKIWMHIKHCTNSAKAIAIQEAQNMRCVDAAASDAENLCKWCLAASWLLFENFCSKIFFTTLQYATHVLSSQSTVEKEFFIRVIEICCKSGMPELSLLVIKLTTLRRKIIQQSIFFWKDLFSSSGYLHV